MPVKMFQDVSVAESFNLPTAMGIKQQLYSLKRAVGQCNTNDDFDYHTGIIT